MSKASRIWRASEYGTGALHNSQPPSHSLLGQFSIRFTKTSDDPTTGVHLSSASWAPLIERHQFVPVVEHRDKATKLIYSAKITGLNELGPFLMRNEWYGDKRDLIKWPTLLHLAQREGIGRIFQIAMCTDTEPVYPEIMALDGQVVLPQDVTEHVADHFHNHNDLNGIAALGGHFGIEIEVWMEEFTHAGRDDYFAGIDNEILMAEIPTLWFFDPDTGIEPPSGANKKHLKLTELANAFALIHPGDYLACYQHAWRAENWQMLAVQRLSQQLHMQGNQVEVFTSDYANDVMIMAVTPG